MPLCNPPWSADPGPQGVSPTWAVCPPIVAESPVHSAQPTIMAHFVCFGHTGKGLLATLLRGLSMVAEDSLVGGAGSQPSSLQLASHATITDTLKDKEAS